MPKPYAYSGVSLKTFSKKYRHFFWIALVPLFLMSFSIAEKHITTNYWVSYSRLDDMISFVPEFVIFYTLWYPMLFSIGIYLLLRDAAGYKRYLWTLMSGFFITLLFYVIVPNGQNLRPDTFAENTLFTRAVTSIYAIDTNTNVLPSMHVIGTVVAAFAIFHAPGLEHARIRVFTITLAVLVILSTVFIKQHSVLDIFAGLALCVPLYIVFYVFVKRRQGTTRV